MRRVFVVAVSLLALGCGNGGSSSGSGSSQPEQPDPLDITASPLAARTSGVAPLAVFFEAAATDVQAGQDPFLGVEYHWSFGDSNGGTWGPSGRSKGTDTGPVAGHVYDRPGTYTVTLTAHDGSGTSSTRTATITVANPDVVFSGQNTICFSQTGNFTGAPAGALLISGSSWSAFTSRIAAGKRLLLRRGETWSPTSSITANVSGPGIIGAFGTGARPLIRLAGNQTLFAPRLVDWRIMDLDIDGLNGGETRGFRASGHCRQTLIYRCAARNVKNGFTFSTSQLGSNGTIYDQVAIIDSSVNHVIGDLGGNGSMFAGRRVLFMGNTYDDAEGAEHILRLPWVQGGLIAHCDLGRPRSTKHVIKLHAPPFSSSELGAGQWTERVMIAHNIIRGGRASWALATGPEDNHTDQRVRRVLLEGNYFKAGPSTQVAAYLSCVSLLARNNVVDMTGGSAGTAFWVARRGVEPAPSDQTFLHNTAYVGDTNRFTFLTVSSAASDVLSRGNLGSAPNTSQKTMLSGNAVSQYNILTNTAGFLQSTPQSAGDFQLRTGSVALATVPPIAEVWDDFAGADRTKLGMWAAGAFQPTGVSQPPPPPPPPPEGEEIIVDNGAAGTSSTGTWQTSGSTSFYGTGSRYSKSVGATYTWSAALPSAGRYSVYAWWTYVSSRTPAARYAITRSGGSTTVTVDQRINGGKWNFLGTFDFGTTGRVVLTSDSTTYSTSADAVRFVSE